MDLFKSWKLNYLNKLKVKVRINRKICFIFSMLFRWNPSPKKIIFFLTLKYAFIAFLTAILCSNLHFEQIFFLFAEVCSNIVIFIRYMNLLWLIIVFLLKISINWLKINECLGISFKPSSLFKTFLRILVPRILMFFELGYEGNSKLFYN